jgi:hypothetical protein
VLLAFLSLVVVALATLDLVALNLVDLALGEDLTARASSDPWLWSLFEVATSCPAGVGVLNDTAHNPRNNNETNCLSCMMDVDNVDC